MTPLAKLEEIFFHIHIEIQRRNTMLKNDEELINIPFVKSWQHLVDVLIHVVVKKNFHDSLDT